MEMHGRNISSSFEKIALIHSVGFLHQHRRSKLAIVSILCLLTTLSVIRTTAWSNGGYSDDPSNPDYGTHDWIAEHALDWLPVNEKEYITSNLAAYLYGTELPDNPNPEDGIGDTTKHHVYYASNGSLIDDSAALRAQEEYDQALIYLKENNLAMAAKTLGIMSHYIADMAVFGHVMGSTTDWGVEVHHSDYESYLNTRTNSYVDDFNVYLLFDGSLCNISAHDATISLAYDTTFDIDGDLTCLWMDENYDWSNPTFNDRCGESLSLAVNYLADVLHTLYGWQASILVEAGNLHIVINEVELNPPEDDRLSTTMEWVELYNPTSSSVDIGGWTLSTTHGETVTLTIRSGTILQPKDYLVVENSRWLDNEDELLILRNSIGEEMDRTPIISDGENDNGAWARFPNGKDSDSFSDWRFQSSTKGYSNGGEVQKGSSSITCSSSPSAPTLRSRVTVLGYILPAHGGVDVKLSFTPPNGSVISRTIGSASDGSYSFEFFPDSVGTWRVKASWLGDSDHEGAESSFATFTVSKVSSSITVSLPSEIRLGQKVTIRGSISPVREGASVKISWRAQGGVWKEVATTLTDSAGSFSYDWINTPNVAGAYEVKVFWEGDSEYEGSEKVSSLKVLKLRSSISIGLSESTITFGESIELSASMDPPLGNVSLVIIYNRPNGSRLTRTVITSETGSYIDSLKPDTAGTWSAKASWSGNSNYEGAESNVLSFVVNKAPTLIETTISRESLELGQSLTVSGEISPSPGQVVIEFRYERPDGSTVSRRATTSEDGRFEDTYEPDKEGVWNVEASWPGSENYEPATSTPISFSVKQPFPIAYAAAGIFAVGIAATVLLVLKMKRK